MPREKLSWARAECHGVLVTRRVAVVFGSHQVRAPPYVGTREVPWPSPESWGLDLGLKGTAGPEPGVSSDHRTPHYPGVAGTLAARAQPASATAGRGPWAAAGEAGPEPGADEKEEGSCPPTRSCQGARDRGHLSVSLRDLSCLAAGEQGTSPGIWFQKPLNPRGLGTLLRASWDKTLPETQAPPSGLFINVSNNKI